jgi:CHAT domain-containing protein
MYAGSRRVLATLWKVDDEATSELMTRFYRAMFERGLSPSAALRSAQLEMLQSTRWRNPFYWAAFVLQGDWR